MTISVLTVWCTTTLSMTTCVKSGVASASSWIASEASSTSRQIGLCLSSSGTNQRKPNGRGRLGAGVRVGDRLARQRELDDESGEARGEALPG